MGATLEALLELQDVELQIVDIRRQLAQKERLVRRQSAKLEAAQAKLAQERSVLQRNQIEIDELDMDLKGRSAQVTRLREHLNSVKTNKEYAAVLAQLNNEKADASRLEARALQMMEGLESQRQAVAECEREEQEGAARLGDLKSQSAQSQRTFSEKLEELQGRRKRCAEALPRETMSLFERLSERYEGEVLARIERTHPRRDEFTCGGCHMTLSAETANAALTRDDVLQCQNCGRILYILKGT
ncbi:MAG: C4-type zinc ribbon domain-containing protein [Phycisphaerae bacterium]|jgi:predicted  nucleic acid-binding Zn-ribbon protein